MLPVQVVQGPTNDVEGIPTATTDGERGRLEV